MGYSPEAAARRSSRSGSAPRSRPATTTGLRGAIGTPDQLREYLRRYEECGVDQVIFVLQAGKNRHEHIMESARAVRDGGAARVHRSATRSSSPRRRSAWSRVVEKVLARKERTERDLDGYTFPALPRKWADDTGSEEMKEWLAKFAEDRALGKNDATLGINV